jgi:hypothetical protein
MPDPVKMAFERQVVSLPLSDILPMRRVLAGIKQTARYKRIVCSISEVGLSSRWSSPGTRKKEDLSCWLTAICGMPLCSTSAAAKRRA